MGLDLVDFFRGRHSWRKLWLILDRLPTSSAYREAVLDDPEVAEALMQRLEPQRRSAGPRLSEFDTNVALLTDIYDRLGDVIAAVVMSNGGKDPKVRPAPRPLTGLDRARKRLEDRQFAALEAEFKAAQERWEHNQREGV